MSDTEIPAELREKAREIVRVLEAVPSDGIIHYVAAALLAAQAEEREKIAGMVDGIAEAHEKAPVILRPAFIAALTEELRHIASAIRSGQRSGE